MGLAEKSSKGVRGDRLSDSLVRIMDILGCTFRRI